MPTIQETLIDSLEEYVHVVDSVTTSPADPVWYRGAGKASYRLLPSLYRHPGGLTPARLLQMENDLLTRFKERAVPHLETPLSGDWEFLFLMQHFGVPTRLLDWTENPFIALFFALTSAPRDSRGAYTEPASVWILSPKKWNQTTFLHFSFSGSVLSVSHEYIKAYAPKANSTDTPPALPAAIFGIHNSPRIIAQRGVFTIFGSSTAPMEETFSGSSSSYPADTLVKVNVPPTKVSPLLEKLLAMGYTDAVMFPDLEGLARETKRIYGFEG